MSRKARGAAVGVLLGVVALALPFTAQASTVRLKSPTYAIKNVGDDKKAGEIWYELVENRVSGVADVRVHIRDTRTDGWCARAEVHWHLRWTEDFRTSAVVKECAGIWTTVTARPIRGPVPLIEYLKSVTVLHWSGPESQNRTLVKDGGRQPFCAEDAETCFSNLLWPV